MVPVKELEIKVTYTVTLIDVEIPEEVKKQLLSGHKLIPNYLDKTHQAVEWIIDNIKERDSWQWEAEVENINM